MSSYRNRIVGLEYVSSADLTPHPGNWRDHPNAQVEAMRGVLAEVGIADALLAYRSERNGGKLTVIDGHLRKDVAPQVWPVLVLDVTDAEADYILATHDPLTAMAQADAAALDALLDSINSGEAAVQRMLAELAADAGLYTDEPKIVADVEPQIDRAEELRQKWGVESGQLWQLGEHRLICGDCTDADVVARVMGGERAQLLFTSPPYAQQRDYRDDATEKVRDWDALMQGAFGAAICADDCQVLVNLGLVHRDGEWIPYWDGWIEWMRQQGWRRFGWYVWDQGSGLPGDWSGRLAPAFEFVFHFNQKAIRPQKWVEAKLAGQIAKNRTFRHNDGRLKPFTQNGVAYGDTKIPDSVIRVNRQTGNANHPAPFSVDFAAFVIRSWPGLVYEPFSGSGTTIIACEQLGRKCRAVEISPAYVAVALERFYTATGIEPVCVPG